MTRDLAAARNRISRNRPRDSWLSPLTCSRCGRRTKNVHFDDEARENRCWPPCRQEGDRA